VVVSQASGHNPIRVAVIGNSSQTLLRFREPLVSQMVGCDARVYALAPDWDAERAARIRELGAEPISISLDRTGTNPVRDLADLVRLTVLLRRLALDATLAYFTKSVIYGSLAAAAAGVPQRFSLIAGLGYAFAEDPHQPSPQRRALRYLLGWLYRQALQGNQRVFIQNADDLELLVAQGWVRQQQAIRVNGTGVDLSAYACQPPAMEPVTFLLAARPVAEKGLREFAAAARQIKAAYPGTRFILLGDGDCNPGRLGRAEIRGWVAQGLLEWPGQVADIRPWLAQTSVYVLPSYYREGMPRSIQEAMAAGRPIVTADVPGCRETVADGQNGYLVLPRAPTALTRALLAFIERPERIATMGRESRRLAEQKFDVHQINAQIVAAMGLPPARSARARSAASPA